MKIVDEAPSVHRAESMPARSAAHAGTWLAQLERAWLDRWNAAGEGAPPATHRPAAHAHASDARQDVATAARDALSRPMAASAPCGVASRPAASCAHDIAGVNRGVDRSLGGVLAQPLRAGGPSAEAPTPPHERSAPAPSPVPSKAADDVDGAELPSARNAGQRPHHAMEPPPSRTLLQVWVAHSTAQVTLRDASLSQDEVARTGRAVATELLGLGVYAVRIYVNGVEGRYGSLAREAEPAPQRIAAGAHVHSLPYRLK